MSAASTTRNCIGIMGGGQLARMLWQAAQKLELPCRIYAQREGEPASFVSPDIDPKNEISIGSLNDEKALATFCATVNRLTFENEFLDIALFERVLRNNQAAVPSPVEVLPSLAHLSKTQDKLAQKTLFKKLNLPSAEFTILRSEVDLRHWFSDGCGGWGDAILKWSRLGYDGKGNYHAHAGSSLNEILLFFEKGHQQGAEIYAERKVAFRREIAIQATHARSAGISSEGTTVLFPVVISEQKNGICHRVWGPARAWDLGMKAEQELRGAALSLAQVFGLEGTFAVEAFELPDGSILINEIAPRVHNTGHATQSVCDHSQFDLHMRAVAGLSLPTPRLVTPFFAMLNILGTTNTEGLTRLTELFSQPMASLTAAAPQVSGVETAVTWYDKEPRAGRKLGHINFWSEQQNQLKIAVQQWEEWIYHGQ